MGYIYIIGLIIFSSYAQIVGKWRINALEWELPDGTFLLKAWSYIKLLFDPYMLTCAVAATAASFCWNMAISKMNITSVLSITSAIPMVVFMLGVVFLGESFTAGKLVGLLLVVAGVIVAIKS